MHEIYDPEVAFGIYRDVMAANKRTAESRRIVLPDVFKYAGSQEIRFGEIPDNVMKLMKQSITRGFSKTRNGIVPFLADLACRMNPHEQFRLGFVCRSYLLIYVDRDKGDEALTMLKALADLSDRLEPKRFYEDLFGCTATQKRIYYAGGGHMGKGILQEAEAIIHRLTEHEQKRREAVVQWLETKPIGRLHFAMTYNTLC